jgi:hypothetical protein
LGEYDKVTVYTTRKNPKININLRPVKYVEPSKNIGARVVPYMARDSKMAVDADEAIVIWDGKSMDTFVNLMNMLLQNKKVYLYNTEKFKTTEFLENTYDGLRFLIPKNPDYVSHFDFLPNEMYESAVKACEFSAEMEEYLLKNPVSKVDTIGMIMGAPISLEKKKRIVAPLIKTDNLFEELFSIDNPAERESIRHKKEYLEKGSVFNHLMYYALPWSFTGCYNEICGALNELEIKDGEFFTVKDCWYDYDIFEIKEYLIGSFTSIEAAMNGIKEDIKFEFDDDYVEGEPINCWYEIQKWVPVGDGKLASAYTYYIDRDKILYFDREDYDNAKEKGFFNKLRELSSLQLMPDVYSRYYIEPHDYIGVINRVDLDLPIPFKVGDIVTLDVMPFADVKHALLIEVDNSDCCGVQILYYDEKTKKYQIGALKHGCGLYWHDTPMLSSLYRLKKYDGILPKEEKIFSFVSEFLNGDSKKGRAFYNAVYELKKDFATAKQIKEIINNG